MKSYTTTAYVIKVKLLREADYLIVLLTTQGRVEAKAKGLGKPRSRKTGQIDLLNKIKAKLYASPGLDLVIEADLLDDFAQLKSSLENIKLIFTVLEVLDHFTTLETFEDDEFFTELDVFLSLARKHSTDSEKFVLLFNAFTLHILRIAGFKPALDIYLESEIPIRQGEKRVAASGSEAGYLPDVRAGSEPIYVGDDILKIQKFMASSSLEQALRLNISPEQNRHLQSIHLTWLEGIIEKRLEVRKLK